MNTKDALEKKNYDLFKGKSTTASSMMMNLQQKYVPLLLNPNVNDTTSISTASSNITTTTTDSNNVNNDNKWDEQTTEATLSSDERAAMKTANVDDEGENRRAREKGEREKREYNIKRTLTSTTTTREQEKTEERERVTQPNKNTDSVTSFTSEQHSCPSVVRLSVDDSMANRVSSSHSRNNLNQNTSSSNNRSSRSTFTTHTYASTNTCNSEPTYTTAHITGDPRTLHSYYVSSPNYRPPSTSPASSLTRRRYDHEPSYPSISRFRTPSPSSPYRKTHYLDDSDEEIINEEILEITDLNHYPTLIERWGDDTKTVVRQEGELKFEDFVEFEETEPTIVEEILYELVYSGDKLKACRQIHRSRSESRNFRKIKKRRTKRKLQLNDDSSYLTSQATSRDSSSTRSPYYNDSLYSPERSITSSQSTIFSSRQSAGFLPNDKLTLDIPVRSHLDDQNYVNHIRVNENDPFLPHAPVEQYPHTRITNNHTAYKTLLTDSVEKRTTDLLDHMLYLSNQIDTLITTDDDDGALIESEKYTPVISENRGVTKITLSPTGRDQTSENLTTETNIDDLSDTNDFIPLVGNDTLLTFAHTEQSRTSNIDQKFLQNEINRK
jgi:hypothetical protein